MYAQEFFWNEDGVETMEWIAILAVTAVLIGIISRVATSLKTKTNGLAGTI